MWADNVTKQTRTLFVSAGHSYSDPGAVGNGKTEAEIVLDLRDRVADELNRRGVVCACDGVKGENLPLSEAIKLASLYDVAVEFHCNAFSNPSATGVETLSDDDGMTLGQRLCDAVAGAMSIANRGAKSEGSGQHSRLGFVSNAGGIILELFFITNPHDMRAYYNNLHGVVSAICDVLQSEVAE